LRGGKGKLKDSSRKKKAFQSSPERVTKGERGGKRGRKIVT